LDTEGRCENGPFAIHDWTELKRVNEARRVEKRHTSPSRASVWPPAFGRSATPQERTRNNIAKATTEVQFNGVISRTVEKNIVVASLRCFQTLLNELDGDK
jgi:hypothetical protein